MRVLLSTLVALSLGVFITTQVALAQTPAPKAGAPAAGAAPKAAPKAAPRPPVYADKTPADLVITLQPLVTRAGIPCKVVKAGIVGTTAQQDLYEVACDNDTGEVLSIDIPPSATSAVSARQCVTFLTGGKGPNLCKLTTPDQNLAPFQALATKVPHPCTITNQRFVETGASGNYYLEYACSDGSGYMLQASPAGEFKSQIPCIQAGGFGDGCTLTDAMKASEPQRAALSAQAKAAGFDCDVTKFGAFEKSADVTYDATEIACGNRPEGGVLITSGPKPVVLNCVRARSEDMPCHMTKEALDFPAITTQLKSAPGLSKHFTGCDVNGTRSLGASKTLAFVEVTCADGTPGFVLVYPIGEDGPKDLWVCSQAAENSVPCKMAPNLPK